MSSRHGKSGSHRRLIVRFALAIVAGAVGVALMVGPAFAHHPDVVAEVSCTGLVSFTSASWDGPTTASKTNPTIQVSYSLNGGSFTVLPQKPAYHFGVDNSFSFSDTFQLATPLPTTVIVKVLAAAPWGNGESAGDHRQTSTIYIPDCPETTTTTAPPTTTTTTVPATTTTTEPTTTTTTTAPPTTTSTTSTTAPVVTTTTAASLTTTTPSTVTSTTTNPSTVTVGAISGSSPTTVTAVAELPRTGGSGMPLGLVALSLLAVGAVLVRVVRWRVTHT